MKWRGPKSMYFPSQNMGTDWQQRRRIEVGESTETSFLPSRGSESVPDYRDAL